MVKGIELVVVYMDTAVFPLFSVNPIFLKSFIVCGTEGLLTNDVETLDSIIGSSSIPSNSPVDYAINDLVSTSGRGWCATGNLGSDPYIQLNFTSMVSLTYMKAKAYLAHM